MESAAPLVFGICFALGEFRFSIPGIVFFGLWEAHYIHRAFIYPLQRRNGDKQMPLAVICPGFIFNSVNGYLNGRFVFSFSGGYSESWLTDPRFLAGVVLFVAGFIINRDADVILSSLRKPGQSGYSIPSGGLYRFISCPNYLGEILIWSGWALSTWSLAGLSFAVWTIANLVPRARSNHVWYQTSFPKYPRRRKALIPWIW